MRTPEKTWNPVLRSVEQMCCCGSFPWSKCFCFVFVFVFCLKLKGMAWYDDDNECHLIFSDGFLYRILIKTSVDTVWYGYLLFYHIVALTHIWPEVPLRKPLCVQERVHCEDQFHIGCSYFSVAHAKLYGLFFTMQYQRD